MGVGQRNPSTPATRETQHEITTFNRTTMTDYRRHWLAGGTFFFTVALAERSSSLLVDHIDDLKQAIRYAKNEYPFHIVAMVVLPEHLHTIWTLPENDADYATRWKMIKARFSRGIPRGERRSASRIAKGERGIWQRRYWEHTIRDDEDFRRHIDYIHYNPMKHGYVCAVADWPHSTFHSYVRDGVYPADWGGSADIGDTVFGE